MIKILSRMFEANPEKSTIVLKLKCSDCGREIIIDITRRSGGFGLQGGALLKCSDDAYCAKCPGCYEVDQNEKIMERRKQRGSRLKMA